MNWKKIIATGFGTGYLPIGPGSWGTFPGMLLCWAMQPLPVWGYVAMVIFLACVGVHIAGEVEPEFGKKDPGQIVIDEIVAFPITMFLIPISWGTMVLGFFLNRLIDTIKPWPACRLERLAGGWGIMMDDLCAGVYSCLLMHAALAKWPAILAWKPFFLSHG